MIVWRDVSTNCQRKEGRPPLCVRVRSFYLVCVHEPVVAEALVHLFHTVVCSE